MIFGALLLAGDPDVNADVSVKATTIVRHGAAHQLRGNARLETSAVEIRADEIDYNQDTNEIDARGSVHVKLKGNPSYLFVDGPKQDRQPVRRPAFPPEIIR